MNYPLYPQTEYLEVPESHLLPEEDTEEIASGFFNIFHADEIHEILEGWAEVIACSQDTLYEDWKTRAAAFAFCKNLEKLLVSLSRSRRNYPDNSEMRDREIFYLPKKEMEILEKISLIIQDSIRVARIICFGWQSRMLMNLGEHVHPLSLHHFLYFLVLTPEMEKRPFHEIQDLIEGRCRAYGRLTAVVHSRNFVQSRLKEGDPFFATICKFGILLYDLPDEHAAAYPEPASGARLKFSLDTWQRWEIASSGFLRGASFYMDGDQYSLAVFMLHQAVEHACTGLIQAVTGYRMTTHNLDKLLRFSLSFTGKLWEVFPRDSRKEIDCFLKLQRAYTQARYQEGYEISKQETLPLFERVSQLCMRAAIVFGEYESGLSMQLAICESEMLYPFSARN
jgi:HEPN domain-containing protein